MLKDNQLLEDSKLILELSDKQSETITGGVNSSSGFCLHNETDIDINYSLKTPNGNKWKGYSVSEGKNRWHWIPNTEDLSKWRIRFDSDLRNGKDYDLEYTLTPSLSDYRACEYFKAYDFRKKGEDFLALYTA